MIIVLIAIAWFLWTTFPEPFNLILYALFRFAIGELSKEDNE